MLQRQRDIRKIMIFAVLVIVTYIMVVAPVFGASAGGQGRSDLIAATGSCGQDGYIRQSDIDRFDGSMDDIPVLRDAVKLSRSLENPIRIPLYEKDGSTVIGSFTLI